jgi:hypothetical protein
MSESPPSTLIVPASAPTPTGWFGGVVGEGLIVPTIGIFGLIVVCVGVYFVLVYRHHKQLDPRERAFRALSHRLGLTRRQISTIRQYAAAQGLNSPIGLLVNADMTAQILHADQV